MEDCVPGVYRTLDPIDSMLVHVTLAKRSPANIGRDLNVAQNQGNTVSTDNKTEEGSSSAAGSQANSFNDGTVQIEADIMWQQKIFGPHELLRYFSLAYPEKMNNTEGKKPLSSLLEQKYVEDVKALYEQVGDKLFDLDDSMMFYTYIDEDSAHPSIEYSRSYMQSGGQVNLKARNITGIRTRKNADSLVENGNVERSLPGAADNVSPLKGSPAPKNSEIDEFFVPPSSLSSDLVNPLTNVHGLLAQTYKEQTYSTMYIMAALDIDLKAFANRKMSTSFTEVCIAAIKSHNGSNLLEMRPGFSEVTPLDKATVLQLTRTVKGNSSTDVQAAVQALRAADVRIGPGRYGGSMRIGHSEFDIVNSSGSSTTKSTLPKKDSFSMTEVAAYAVEVHRFVGPDSVYEFTIRNPFDDPAFESGHGASVEAVAPGQQPNQLQMQQSSKGRGQQHFNLPPQLPPFAFLITHYVDILAAAKFECPNIYVAFELVLPRGGAWRILPPADAATNVMLDSFYNGAFAAAGTGVKALSSILSHQDQQELQRTGLGRLIGSEDGAAGVNDDSVEVEDRKLPRSAAHMRGTQLLQQAASEMNWDANPHILREEETARREELSQARNELIRSGEDVAAGLEGILTYSALNPESASTQGDGLMYGSREPQRAAVSTAFSGVTQVAFFRPQQWTFGEDNCGSEIEGRGTATGGSRVAQLTETSSVFGGAAVPDGKEGAQLHPFHFSTASVAPDFLPGGKTPRVTSRSSFLSQTNVSAGLEDPHGPGSLGGRADTFSSPAPHPQNFVPVAHLGYSACVRLLYDPALQRAQEGHAYSGTEPVLYLSAFTRDSWDRHSVAGYGYLPLGKLAGQRDSVVSCWRPVGGTQDLVSDFFVGGGNRLRDVTVVRAGVDASGSGAGPGVVSVSEVLGETQRAGGKGSAVLARHAARSASKLGMVTETAGEIAIRTSAVKVRGQPAAFVTPSLTSSRGKWEIATNVPLPQSAASTVNDGISKPSMSQMRTTSSGMDLSKYYQSIDLSRPSMDDVIQTAQMLRQRAEERRNATIKPNSIPGSS